MSAQALWNARQKLPWKITILQRTKFMVDRVVKTCVGSSSLDVNITLLIGVIGSRYATKLKVKFPHSTGAILVATAEHKRPPHGTTQAHQKGPIVLLLKDSIRLCFWHSSMKPSLGCVRLVSYFKEHGKPVIIIADPLSKRQIILFLNLVILFLKKKLDSKFKQLFLSVARNASAGSNQRLKASLELHPFHRRLRSKQVIKRILHFLANL